MSQDDDTKERVITVGPMSSLIKEKSGVFRVDTGANRVQTKNAAPRKADKFSLFRLAKDLAECRANPLPMIAAEPVSDENLYEWHANLMGPTESSYEDICFHFIIEIPKDYPKRAPKVEIQSYFEHPNIFGKWICLDMLEGQWCRDNSSQTKKDVGYGWTPAYSIQAILVQLQAF